jgi:hypothetical protein
MMNEELTKTEKFFKFLWTSVIPAMIIVLGIVKLIECVVLFFTYIGNKINFEIMNKYEPWTGFLIIAIGLFTLRWAVYKIYDKFIK